jgi:hypothetical protein
MIPSLELRGLFTIPLVHFAKEASFWRQNLPAQMEYIQYVHPQTSELHNPAEARKLTRPKLTLNPQARKVRPKGFQGDLGHYDVRRPVKVDELDTAGSPSTANTQTSV